MSGAGEIERQHLHRGDASRGVAGAVMEMAPPGHVAFECVGTEHQGAGAWL